MGSRDVELERILERGVRGGLTVEWERRGCIGVCHEVEVSVGGIAVKVPVFVVENVGYDLILGRPWERFVRAEHINGDDGTLRTKIKSRDGSRIVEMITAPANHERNRRFARATTPTVSSLKSLGDSPAEGELPQRPRKLLESVRVESIQVETIGLKSHAERRRMTKRLSTKNLLKWVSDMMTVCKRKDKKVHPANTPLPRGLPPEEQLRSWDMTEVPRTDVMTLCADKTVPRGGRLTPERLADLKIEVRIQQLDERELDESIATEQLEKARRANKKYFDRKPRRLRPEAQRLRVGDLVLLHNTVIDALHNVKLEDRWLGPYRIWEVSEAGYYRIEELDGVQWKESVAGNRLKKFWVRRGHGENDGEAEETQESEADSEFDEIEVAERPLGTEREQRRERRQGAMRADGVQDAQDRHGSN